MRLLVLTSAVLTVLGTAGWAQDGATQFGDKLGVMPVANTNRPLIGGTGNVSATLDGSTLEIEGSYEGLRGEANRLALHAARPGMAGPEIAAVEIAGAQAGDLDVTIELTPEQVALLQDNHIYVVLQTSRNTTGELRAWLMAQ
jgi:hypothetical protein